jgi:hypothetical protein
MIKRLLYFGTLEYTSINYQRLEALRTLVEHIYAVDMRIFQTEMTKRSKWLRLQIRLGIGPVVRRLAEGLIFEARRYKPDVVWIDQGLCVRAEALKQVRADTRAFLVHYTPDPMNAPGFSNLVFRKAIPQYDVCITNKGRDVDAYMQSGAKRTLVSIRGYDPRINRPMVLSSTDTKKYGCDVFFAGHRLEERARSLAHLVGRLDCRINLYGRKWEEGSTGPVLGPLCRGWIGQEEYNMAMNAAKICLGFLSRHVGDTVTGRSVEIPASGSFMLAERTDDHLAWFEEDKEAAYFESDDELVDKVRFYLAHDELRKKIARAGYEKVKRLGLTWRDILSRRIAEIETLMAERAAR